MSISRFLYIVVPMLLFCSCVPPVIKKIPKQVSYYGFDFSEHSENGFYITTEFYADDYIPIGLVTVEIFPEANYVEEKIVDEEGFPDYIYTWEIEKISGQEAVDSLVAISKAMGANAIVNFKYEALTKERYSNSDPIILSGIRVEGFAIKRRE